MVSSNIMMLPPVSPPRSLSENDRPGDTGPCPGGTTMLRAPIANFSSFLSRSECSCRLALDRPRVVDIEIDNLSGRGRSGHQRHALRRVKAVPRTLRDDSDHSGAKPERLGPVVAHDFQGRGAVQDVDQLVAGQMGFPMTFPRELGGEKGAVAIGSQSSAASLAIRHRRLRGPSTEHGQLREFRVEVDDAGRSGCYYFLRLCRPRVVDIELNVVAGKGRAPGCSALCRVKAVPHTLRNDRDHSGAKHEGLRRPVVADNFQGLRTVENVN